MRKSLSFPLYLGILCTASAFVTPQLSFSHQKVPRTFTNLRAFASLASDDNPEQFERKGFGNLGLMQPGRVSPLRPVPASIARPDYSMDRPLLPVKKSRQEMEAMKESARIAREVLDEAGRAVRVGISTDEIDEIVHNECIKRGAYPSPLRYNGFPKSCCTSVNEVACHGIPDSYRLRDGDIINIDVTVFYNGFHGDCSETYCVGNVLPRFKKLVKAAYDAMMRGIEACQVGKPYSVIGAAVKRHLDQFGFCSPVQYVGHGIGRMFHEPPDVIHTELPFNTEGLIEEGHVFTVEPVVCMGTDETVTWDDGWTVATADGMRSAQFEHTVAMTADGPIRLTERLPTSPKFWWELEEDEAKRVGGRGERGAARPEDNVNQNANVKE